MASAFFLLTKCQRPGSLGETKKDRNDYESLYDTYDIKKEVAKLQKLYEDMI